MADKQKKALAKILQIGRDLRVNTIINFAQQKERQSCPIIISLEIVVDIPLKEKEQSDEWIREQLGEPEKVLRQILGKL